MTNKAAGAEVGSRRIPEEPGWWSNFPDSCMDVRVKPSAMLCRLNNTHDCIYAAVYFIERSLHDQNSQKTGWTVKPAEF